MQQPLFTIITLSLNCVDKIMHTVSSVQSQRFRNIEYLIKDGGSTDGTIEKLQTIPNVRVISEYDSGIYPAMNEAIKYSQGEYICFMNAGDEFPDTEVLDRVAETIIHSHRPDMLYGNIRSRSHHPHLGKENRHIQGRLVVYPKRLGRFWLYRKMICHQAWFVRRDIYAAHPFDINLRILADYYYLLDMIRRRRVRYVHIPSVVAVFEGGGLSSVDSPQRSAERQKILNQFYPSTERTLYEGLFSTMRFLNRKVVYPLIYPLLSERLRGRVSGL